MPIGSKKLPWICSCHPMTQSKEKLHNTKEGIPINHFFEWTKCRINPQRSPPRWPSIIRTTNKQRKSWAKVLFTGWGLYWETRSDKKKRRKRQFQESRVHAYIRLWKWTSNDTTNFYLTSSFSYKQLCNVHTDRLEQNSNRVLIHHIQITHCYQHKEAWFVFLLFILMIPKYSLPLVVPQRSSLKSVIQFNANN